MSIAITPHELHTLLRSTMRFSFQRRTELPAFAAKAIRDYWHHLPADNQALFIRDLGDELRICERIGDALPHHELWVILYKWMVKHEKQ